VRSKTFRNVYKDVKLLELGATNADETENWKAAFLRAGVYPEKAADSVEEGAEAVEDVPSTNPALEREAEIIRNCVESYVKIVTKAVKDQVPKAIMHLVVNRLCSFVKEELLAQLYQTRDLVCSLS